MINIFSCQIGKVVNSFFVISLLLVGSTAWPAGVAAAAGEVVNPSFEEQGVNSNTANGWTAFGSGYKRVKTAHTGTWGMTVQSRRGNRLAGAAQRVDLKQSEMKPVQITGYVKGNNIVNTPGGWFGASLYAEIHLADGSVAYWNSIPNVGTFGWRWIGFNTGTLPAVNQPIDHIFVVPILGDANGQAWFDDIAVKEYESGTGAVTIMFDDGELTAYSEGVPAMEHHGFKGTTAVITEMVGEEEFMDWEQLRELQQKQWEIVSHGLTHTDLTTLSVKERRPELVRSKRVLERKGLVVNHFALPYGAYNTDIMALGMGTYKSIRAYEQGANPAGTLPWEVKVRGTTSATTAETVAEWVGEAQSQGKWIVIVFHKIAQTGDDAYFTTPGNMEEMLQVIQDSGVEVVTYNGGWQKFGAL